MAVIWHILISCFTHWVNTQSTSVWRTSTCTWNYVNCYCANTQAIYQIITANNYNISCFGVLLDTYCKFKKYFTTGYWFIVLMNGPFQEKIRQVYGFLSWGSKCRIFIFQHLWFACILNTSEIISRDVSSNNVFLGLAFFNLQICYMSTKT